MNSQLPQVFYVIQLGVPISLEYEDALFLGAFYFQKYDLIHMVVYMEMEVYFAKQFRKI